MIRPFSLRDVPLVRRLGGHALSLQVEHALTDRHQPLRDALSSLFIGGHYPTYVWKADKGKAAGFVQLYLDEESLHGRIICLALEGAAFQPGRNGSGDEACLTLLEQLVAEVGRHGIHSLVAEVDETGAELVVLRRAGFAVYTRQDVWLASHPPAKPKGEILRRSRSSDDWEIHLLYANTVPRLIQLVEPSPPLDIGTGWVLPEGDEITGFVHLREGPAGGWMRLYIHPKAETQAEEIVEAALHLRPPSPERPLYCCLRRYQSWLQGGLARAGFQLWGSQAVMARHIAQPVQRAVPDLAAVLEASGVSRVAGTTPLIRRANPHWTQSVSESN